MTITMELTPKQDALEEIAPALAAVGISVGQESEATTAQQQAAATLSMRVMKAIQRDLDRITEARDMELDGIRAMAEMEMAPMIARLEVHRRWVLTLSELIEWGKKKSHDSPFGSFGVRSSSASVKCESRADTAAHVAEHAPEFARVEMTIPLLEARERFTEDEIAALGELDVAWDEYKKTLDVNAETLPPGVVKVPEARKPFATIA